MAVIHDVMPAFELFQPATIGDAVTLLTRYGSDAWIMAGGMDSFDWLKDRIKRPSVVIDLSQVESLRGIKALDNGLELGAGTTLTEIVRDQQVRERFGLLAEAAELVASPQIRNQGTIGGNVSQDTRCWYYRAGWSCYRAGGNICYADTPTAINREHAILGADRCVAVNPSDTAPALVALDAQMVIQSAGGIRVVNAEDTWLITRVQQGMASRSYSAGPIGRSEVCLRSFAKKIRQIIHRAFTHPEAVWSRKRSLMIWNMNMR